MQPLEGIKVLDLTRLIPGPYCTMILGDMGADVLKIQDPAIVSMSRAASLGNEEVVAPFRDLLKGLLSPHNPLQRNKRSIFLNLKNEEARNIFLKLVEKSDILVEELRPGVAQRVGIDYETLKKVNPRLIHCAITGYGQDGPYSKLAGHDINYLAMSGVAGLIGERDRDPAIPLTVIGDFAAGGLGGVIGVLLALAARERTGRGQFVDVSMTDGILHLIGQYIATSYQMGEFPKRGETPVSGQDPAYRYYPCKDGKYISVGCIEPWFYANLCQALGRDDLISFQHDLEKREQVEKAFCEAFSSKTRDEWFETLRQLDICVAPVYDLDELEHDPHLAHRQLLVEIDHPTEGRVKQMGMAIKFSETPGAIKTLAPFPGEHTESELLELGYTKEKIAQLRESGAI